MWSTTAVSAWPSSFSFIYRVRKYAKFGVFYAKIVQTTPLRLRRESLRLPEIFGNK